MSFSGQMTADLDVFFNTNELAETVSYTPKGGAARNIKALISRDDRLEAYVRGENTATLIICVKASDVTAPAHGDRYAITNPSGVSETWEFLKEFESDLYIRKLALERELT